MPKKYLQFFTICFLFCFIFSQVNAKPYFNQEDIELSLVDKPFPEDSDEFKNEIEEIILFQKNATKEEIKRAQLEEDLTSEMIALEYPNLTRKKYPYLYNLLDNSKDSAKIAVWKYKSHWAKKRPYQVDKRIKAFLPESKSFSYPSGHTCKSYVLAHVLSLLMPDRRNRFYNRAANVSQHRVIAGMHFPNDLEAGIQLSRAVIDKFVDNKEFKKDFDLARIELDKNGF